MSLRYVLLALLCLSPALPSPALSIVTYNVRGNGETDWTTNSLQVRAIGRQMAYLQPDVVTFNEIPFPYTYEMTNFVKAWLPGHTLAMNSGTDGYLRSVIASRHPIIRSTNWLDAASLVPFGYTNSPSTFTRDLFEAVIDVPGFSQHLHVFTTHLKAGGTTNDFNRRAAEASAISNFFVTVFLTTNATHPYVLTGDLNEDINRPKSLSRQPIQRLISAPTGLRLTTPVNPFNGNDRTWSIQASSLTVRFDYILPGGLLFSNIASSQVFRTDLLNPTPANLLQFDDETASDHLPVMMVFNNPYDAPFQISSIQRTNQFVRLAWPSTPGRVYRVDSATNFTSWTPLATNLTARGTNFLFYTSTTGSARFFRVHREP